LKDDKVYCYSKSGRKLFIGMYSNGFKNGGFVYFSIKVPYETLKIKTYRDGKLLEVKDNIKSPNYQ
jgi:hypothetical protein